MKISPLAIVLLWASAPGTIRGQQALRSQAVEGRETRVEVTLPAAAPAVSPMIYGQMLEDCNDSIIYGGVVNRLGEENPRVTELLGRLRIPVVRWPAGTAIYDYEWRRGVGPVRTAQDERIWGGREYYTFGTDEYLNWCRKIGAEPYINIPMGNNNTFAHSLGEALDWVEYVNGAPDSPMGACRARAGYSEPWGVRYWCLGNENYLGNRFHRSESAEEYARSLNAYAAALMHRFPGISLLGVGHTGRWNATVLDSCGRHLDFLTLHFYLNAQVAAGALESKVSTLFGAEKVEAAIRLLGHELEAYNRQAGRESNPVRFSIDEWNCRHAVADGHGYAFTRKDGRRLYDAAAMACMLNVFVRTSPLVGMANYIFPVNGHGLIKTVGERDAYPSVGYHVFDLYRRLMKGRAADVTVTGPGLRGVSLDDLNVAGDVDEALKGARGDFCFVDCAAVAHDEGSLAVALVNRSYDSAQAVGLVLPAGYEVAEAWAVAHADVCAENTPAERGRVAPRRTDARGGRLTLPPCGVAVLVAKMSGQAPSPLRAVTGRNRKENY